VIIKKEKALNGYVNIIYEDRNQNLWYGTAYGLYKLPKNKLLNTLKTDFLKYAKTNAIDDISHNDVTAIYQDKVGELWIGTDGGGLNRSKNTENLHFLHYQNRPDNANSLAQNQIFAITQDVSGVIWIGTNDGVNKLKNLYIRLSTFKATR
jgi:ligand-binding sensor domain-containing protein